MMCATCHCLVPRDNKKHCEIESLGILKPRKIDVCSGWYLQWDRLRSLSLQKQDNHDLVRLCFIQVVELRMITEILNNVHNTIQTKCFVLSIHTKGLKKK